MLCFGAGQFKGVFELCKNNEVEEAGEKMEESLFPGRQRHTGEIYSWTKGTTISCGPTSKRTVKL